MKGPGGVRMSRKKWRVDEEDDSDWESVGEDATEVMAEPYNEEWIEEMGDLLSATSSLPRRPSYAAAVASNRSTEGSVAGSSTFD